MLAGARELFDLTPYPCVVFTDAPHDGPVEVYAKFLGDRLHVRVIEPELPGLRTYDKAHLDTASAISWSNAFLAELDPIGRSCGAW